MQQHRLAQIVDGLVNLFDTLKQETTVSGFPIKVPVVLKSYVNWATLEQQERKLRRQVFPSIMLNFGEGGARIDGGVQAEFASQGQREDVQSFALIAVIKETRYATKDLTEQVSDMIYSVQRLINGTHDLGVAGVVKVNIRELPQTTAGRAAAVAGTPLEIIVFNVEVTHVYSATNFV